jgi:hypothetical protein
VKKKSCPVCGQRRCVKTDACVEYATQGTINGTVTEITIIQPKKEG